MGWVWGTWTNTPTTLVLLNRDIVKILKIYAHSLISCSEKIFLTEGSINVYTCQNDKNK